MRTDKRPESMHDVDANEPSLVLWNRARDWEVYALNLEYKLSELQGAVDWEAGTGEMSEGVRDALRKAVAISKGGKG